MNRGGTHSSTRWQHRRPNLLTFMQTLACQSPSTFCIHSCCCDLLCGPDSFSVFAATAAQGMARSTARKPEIEGKMASDPSRALAPAMPQFCVRVLPSSYQHPSGAYVRGLVCCGESLLLVLPAACMCAGPAHCNYLWCMVAHTGHALSQLPNVEVL